MFVEILFFGGAQRNRSSDQRLRRNAVLCTLWFFNCQLWCAQKIFSLCNLRYRWSFNIYKFSVTNIFTDWLIHGQEVAELSSESDPLQRRLYKKKIIWNNKTGIPALKILKNDVYSGFVNVQACLYVGSAWKWAQSRGSENPAWIIRDPYDI
jgi:hypothetical protein